jgi:hypothetical protein
LLCSSKERPLSEKELRVEAVRRRLAGESPEEIAADLNRTTRWVRKWVGARHAEDDRDTDWAMGRSQAPLSSPNQTPDMLRDQILAARRRLEANPRAQYGSLAVQWELRRLGVDPIPPACTIERIGVVPF